jgi:hypothetical protein
MRNLLRNIFPIMMVPPGVKPEDYLQFFKADIEKLQCGYVLDLKELGMVSSHPLSCSNGEFSASKHRTPRHTHERRSPPLRCRSGFMAALVSC